MNIKNNKGFTLVELLAVIVVLAIVMSLAVVGITSVLESTRKSAMVADAKSFLEAAHNLVRADEAKALLGEESDFAPKCGEEAKVIDLTKIQETLEQGGKKSPYGGEYKNSHITIKNERDASSNNCSFKYSIFLSDGVYIVADTEDKTKDVSEDKITAANVQLAN